MLKRRKWNPRHSKLALFLAVSPLTSPSLAFFIGSSNARLEAYQVFHSLNKNSLVLVTNQQYPKRYQASDDSFPRKARKLRLCNSFWNLRGGGSSADSDDQVQPTNKENDEGVDFELDRKEQRRMRGMTAALASTYFSVMGAKCALPSVLSLLLAPKTGLTFSYGSAAAALTTQARMARLLGLSTLAIALGKILLGPLIDNTGGIRSLQAALATLTLLMIIITFTQHFSTFAVCWIFVDFIFSSCWAGCINAIHQSFPEKEWGRQIGMLAAGARTGNAAAFALFASVLYALESKMKQPWRVVFGVSALLQLLPISLLTYFGDMTLKQARNDRQMIANSDQVNEIDEVVEERPSLKASIRTLSKEACTPEFWLHLISRSLLMVFASFLLFVPTLMSQVYGSSNAFAAQTGSIYALGCLLSVTTGSQIYSRLSRNGQAFATVGMLGLATLSSLAQLGHVMGYISLSSSASAALLFLWGWAFAIPFYIPPSLYALARGGKQSSATIADVFDIGGFASLAFFNGYVASIQHSRTTAWIPTFQLTTACSAGALVSLTLAILLQ